MLIAPNTGVSHGLGTIVPLPASMNFPERGVLPDIRKERPMKIPALFSLCTSLFFGVLLSGCASIADLKSAMDAAPLCCQSFAEFKHRPLDTATSTDLSLNENSPVFVFEAGKSYFAAYAVPAAISTRKLRVRSFITGSSAFETKALSQLYCPQVSFLNANHQLIASRYGVPAWATRALATGIFPSFVAEFEIPLTASYVVLHTNPAGFGTLVTRLNGAGEPIQHPCGPVAHAELSIV